MLFAVRNGYAPGTARNSKIDQGLNLADSGSDMLTGDPMGMTFVDVLAAVFATPALTLLLDVGSERLNLQKQ